MVYSMASTTGTAAAGPRTANFSVVVDHHDGVQDSFDCTHPIQYGVQFARGAPSSVPHLTCGQTVVIIRTNAAPQCSLSLCLLTQLHVSYQVLAYTHSSLYFACISRLPCVSPWADLLPATLKAARNSRSRMDQEYPLSFSCNFLLCIHSI